MVQKFVSMILNNNFLTSNIFHTTCFFVDDKDEKDFKVVTEFMKNGSLDKYIFANKVNFFPSITENC